MKEKALLVNFVKGLLFIILSILIIASIFASDDTIIEPVKNQPEFLSPPSLPTLDTALEAKFDTIYTDKGYKISFRAEQTLPSESELRTMREDIRKQIRQEKKRGEPIIIIYTADNSLLHFNTEAEFVTTAFLNNLRLEVLPQINDDDPAEQLINTYVSSFIEKVEQMQKVSETWVDRLAIEIEENSNGQPYKGLTANYGNTLALKVKVPSSYLSSGTVTYNKILRGWEVNLPNNCWIRFQLDIVDDHTDDDFGEVILEAHSMKRQLEQDSSFTLHYTTPHKAAVSSIAPIKTFFNVRLECQGNLEEEINPRPSLFTYQPVVYLLPGLWHPDEAAYEKAGVFNSLADLGLDIKPFWFSPSTGDIKKYAEDLKGMVEKTLADYNKERKKIHKVDMIGVSMGGLIARYYLANLGGSPNVGKLITVGTPHLGAPMVNILWDVCPYTDIEIGKQDTTTLCGDYDKFMKRLKELAPSTPEFGNIGPSIDQLRPDGQFITQEIGKIPASTYVVLIAGTKPFIPPQVLDWFQVAKPIASVAYRALPVLVRFGIETTAYVLPIAADNYADFPDSMEPTMDRFVKSFYDPQTDGVVAKGSAHSRGGIEPWLGGYAPRLILPMHHMAMFVQKSSHQLWANEIRRKPYKMLTKGCSAYVYVYDKSGDVVGIKDEKWKMEMENAAMYLEQDDGQVIFLDPDKDYSIVVEGIEDGDFTLALASRKEDKVISVLYEPIEVTAESKAYVDFGKQSDYKLQLDKDGDETIDAVIEPEFVDIVEFEADNYNTQGSIEINIKRSKSGLWTAVIIGVVIIILFAILLFKRRH